MIAGHFGFAAAVKSREPETPLWALMLATVWLDVVFVPLYVAGIETTQLADKGHTGYGANIIYADYTHSFVGMIAVSAVLGVLAGPGCWTCSFTARTCQSCQAISATCRGLVWGYGDIRPCPPASSSRWFWSGPGCIGTRRTAL